MLDILEETGLLGTQLVETPTDHNVMLTTDGGHLLYSELDEPGGS